MSGFKYVIGQVVGRSGTSGDGYHAGGYVTGDHAIHGRGLYVGTGGILGIQTVRGQDIQIAHQKIYGTTGGPTGPRTTAQGIISFT